jgi:phospholipid/cholesterol/gamma-HCH transport system substrate-binding protein
MTFSKEARTGLLVSVSLVIFFIGFSFLKGSDMFSNERAYYCYFEDVEGLVKSANVVVHGYIVGNVSDIKWEHEKGVKVKLLVRKDVPINMGTVAVLAQGDLLGGKLIRLDLGTDPQIIAPEGSLKGVKEAGVIDNVTGQITPLVKTLSYTIASLDTVIAGVNAMMTVQNRQAISASIQSLAKTAASIEVLSKALEAESGELKSVIHNTNSITGSLAKSNDTVHKMLSNLNTVSGQLAKAPLAKTVTELEQTTHELKVLLDKINKSEGSLGMMVNNKDMYNNLNKSVSSLDKLLTDLKEHPSRYVNISVFGGKKSK